MVEAGLLQEQQLKAALNEHRKWGGRLGRTVVEMGFVTETAMAQVLAQQLQLPVIDLDTSPPPEKASAWLRLDLAERYGVFPLAFDPEARTLTVATSDPTNVEHLQALEFATNCKVNPTVCTASSIDRAIRHHYFGEAVSVMPTIPPQQLVANETTYELDELMGELTPDTAPAAPAAAVPERRPAPAGSGQGPDDAAQLRQEVSVLREKVAALEEVASSQVRALRVLLEVLIESGLVGRDEYLEKLHRPE